jgi:nitrate reductase gamma subunit
MSRADLFWWIALPYMAIAIFVAGHAWRYRRDQLGWTARSTQLMEQRLLKWGSLLFHFGVIAVIGGHVLGILIPESWTSAVGIGEGAYHAIALVGGLPAGLAMTAGLAILLYRRSSVAPVRVTTLRGDLAMYPLLAFVTVTGLVATTWNAVDEHMYRETVSPWFRGLFTFRPDASLMADAPLVFQLHAAAAFVLLALWPFSRLVHAWSIPLAYAMRGWILYRSRNPAAALAYERARRAGAERVVAGAPGPPPGPGPG